MTGSGAQIADGCKRDSSGSAWFQCARGTLGCGRIHDGRTPHCCACAGGTCSLHSEPVLEEAEAVYRARAGSASS